MNWSKYARFRDSVVHKNACTFMNNQRSFIVIIGFCALSHNFFFRLLFTQGQHNNHNERDELIASERKLQVLVDDLRETMRHQQDTFAHEKKELVLLSHVSKLFITCCPIFYFIFVTPHLQRFPSVKKKEILPHSNCCFISFRCWLLVACETR